MPKQQQLELACLGALGHRQHVACDPTLAPGWREGGGMLCRWERTTGVWGTGKDKAAREQRRGEKEGMSSRRGGFGKPPLLKPIDGHSVTACVSKQLISQDSP